MVKQADAMWQLALHAAGTRRCEGHGLQVEATEQFALPLLHQVRGAQDGQAGDFATVHQFTHDETRLYRFTDTHVVGNQQTHGVQAQGHEQGHQLVSAGLYRDVAKRTEGAAACTQFETQGIAHEQRGGVVAWLGGVGPGKSGGLDGGELQLGNQGDGVFVGAAQGAQAQQTGGFVKRGIGLNDPFAPTGANEVAGLEMCGGCGHGVF